jgi:protein CpxP
MNTNSRFSRIGQSIRQVLSRRVIVAALIGGLSVSALNAVAHEGMAAMHHHAGPASSADIADHVEEVLQHVYTQVSATDAQKAQIAPLVEQAAVDLAPLQEQFHSGHAQALALLTQDKVDRKALENFRASHMAIADQASRRIVRLIADVDDVLTPAQRQAVAAQLSAHMGLSAQ